MSVAEAISARSKCSRAGVGCVVVGPDQSVLATTYNGPPPGYPADGPCYRWCSRGLTGAASTNYDNCPSNHAEANAVARMAPVLGATAYVNRMCCMTCAKALAAARVHRVVCAVTNIDGHLSKSDTVAFLEDCGVVIDFMER